MNICPLDEEKVDSVAVWRHPLYEDHRSRGCAMADRTTPSQRREFYKRHLRGKTYEAIAEAMGVSRWCVRYWCRCQRDGGSFQNAYRREPLGLLSRFDPKVRYRVLRLRLEHPRWGPRSILHKMKRWGTISEYHILVEATGGVVSQKEHSLLVTNDGCEILTK